MLYNKEKYIKTLIYNNALHDAEIIGLKLENSCFQIQISCKGMNPSYYFKNIDNIIIDIKILDIFKLSFDYLYSSLIINELVITNKNNKIYININKNDLIVAGTKIIYSFEEIRKHDETTKRLDDFLKNS